MATTNNNYKKQQAVNYLEDSITLFMPEKAGSKYVAYVRPGDNIVLNFELKEFKVDIVNGDVQIVFDNASTITLASLASIGFGSNAPVIKSNKGDTYRLEDFLNAIEVLNYNEATLILANRDGVQTSTDKPDVVTMASDQDSTLDEGTPISGVGETDKFTKGTPSAFINPNGVTLNDMSYAGKGNFVVTIYSSNSPFMKDQDSDMPGSIDKSSSANLSTKVFYGSVFENTGTGTYYGHQLSTFNFKNGIGDQKDPVSQVNSQEVKTAMDQPIFVQSQTKSGMMQYVTKLDYSNGVFPQEIRISVPTSLEVTILPGDGCSDLLSRKDGDNTVYICKSPNPLGKMNIVIEFKQNHYESTFDIEYVLEYFNSATGKVETTLVNQPVKIYPASNEEDIISYTKGDLLSSVANPMNVQGSNLDDIIFSGGGYNNITTYQGVDRVFGGIGTDNVRLGLGDDKVWGSIGDDILSGNNESDYGIIANEHDTLYYNNFVEKMSGGNTGLQDSDYNTFNSGRAGVQFFVSMRSADINNAIKSNRASDGDSYTVKLSGNDIIRNIEDIFLTNNIDTVSVGFEAQGWQGMSIDALASSGEDTTVPDVLQDVLQIDKRFLGTAQNFDMAVFSLDTGKLWVESSTSIPNNATSSDYNSQALNFTNFESFIGSNNLKDYFFDVIGSHEQNYKIDGGTSTNYRNTAIDTISMMSSTQAISFDAKSGRISNKFDTTKTAYDYIINFESFVTTNYADEIFASYESNYVYTNVGSELDDVSYVNSSSSVTFDLINSKIYKTDSYDQVIENPKDFKFDEFQDMDTKFNITLTNLIDYIIGSAMGSYVINAGSGRDVLTYQALAASDKITFNALAQGGEVLKNAGAKDTFSWFATGGTAINVSTVIGSQGDDEFNLIEGSSDQANSYDGFEGSDTINYQNVKSSTVLSINYEGAQWSTVFKSSAVDSVSLGNDQFKNMEVFNGGDGDDKFIFSKYVTLDDIKDLNLDLKGGKDTVSFKSLSVDTLYQGHNISLQIVSTDQGSTIQLGFMDGSNFHTVTDPLLFGGVEIIEGTSGDDILIRRTAALGNLLFSGYQGKDVIDYSEIAMDLTFDMSQTQNNIYKTGETDTINHSDTVEKIYHIIGSSTQKNKFVLNNSSYMIDGSTNYSDQDNNILSYSSTTGGISAKSVTLNIEYSAENHLFGTTDKADGAQDIFTNITKFIGSSKNDTFNIKQNNSGNIIEIYLDGGLGDADVLSFANLSGDTGVLLTFINGALDTSGGAVIYGGYSFHMAAIENIIGTSQDDTFTLSGAAYYNIDGASGTDTITYADVAAPTFILLFDMEDAKQILKITKAIGGKSVYDFLTNIENIELTDGNDEIKVKSIEALKNYKNIDVKDGVNKLNLEDLSTESTVVIKKSIANTGFIYEFDGVDNLPELDGFIELSVSKSQQTTLLLDSDISVSSLHLYNSSDSQIFFKFSEALVAGNPLTVNLNFLEGSKRAIKIDNIAVITLYSGPIKSSIMELTEKDDMVYGTTSYISLDLQFGAGNDTLTYETMKYVNLTIDLDNSLVYKGSKEIKDADKYIDLETIKGSKGDDTVILPILSNTTIAIDLQIDSEYGNDTIKASDETSYTYSVTTNQINNGDHDIDTSKITGAEKIALANKNDIINMGNNWTTTGMVVFIDAGEQDDLTTGDILDFSVANSTSSYIEYFQFSGKDWGYFQIQDGNNNYDQIDNKNIQIENIETVAGSTLQATHFISKVSKRDIYYQSQFDGTTMLYKTSSVLTVNVSSLVVNKGATNDYLTGNFDTITTGGGADQFVIDKNLLTNKGTDVIFNGGDSDDSLVFDNNLNSAIKSIDLTDTGISLLTVGATPENIKIGTYNSVNTIDATHVNSIVNISSNYNESVNIVEDGSSNDAIIYSGAVVFTSSATDTIIEVNRSTFIDKLVDVRHMQHLDSTSSATWNIANQNIQYTLQGNKNVANNVDTVSYLDLADIEGTTLDFTFTNNTHVVSVNKGTFIDNLADILALKGSANLVNKYIVDPKYDAASSDKFTITAQSNDIISFALQDKLIVIDLGDAVSIFATTGLEFTTNTTPHIYELTKLNDIVTLNDQDFTSAKANNIKGGAGNDKILLGDVTYIIIDLKMLNNETDISLNRSLGGTDKATDEFGSFESLAGEHVLMADISIDSLDTFTAFKTIDIKVIAAANNTLNMANINADATASTGTVDYAVTGGVISNYKLDDTTTYAITYAGFNTINLISNIVNTVNIDFAASADRFSSVTFVSGSLSYRSEATFKEMDSDAVLTIDSGEDTVVSDTVSYKFLDFKTYDFKSSVALTKLTTKVNNLTESRDIRAKYKAVNEIDFTEVASGVSDAVLAISADGTATYSSLDDPTNATTMEGFASIILGNLDNAVSLAKLTTPTNTIKIEMGTSGNNELNLAGYTAGAELTFSASGNLIISGGYTITGNVGIYGGTKYDDTLKFSDNNVIGLLDSKVIDGGGQAANDTVEIGVADITFIVEDDATLLQTSAGKSLELTNWEIYNFTTAAANIVFEFSTTAIDQLASSYDFKAQGATIQFDVDLGNKLRNEFNLLDSTHNMEVTLQDDTHTKTSKFLGIKEVLGTQGLDTFIIATTDSADGIIFDGNDGNDVLQVKTRQSGDVSIDFQSSFIYTHSYPKIAFRNFEKFEVIKTEDYSTITSITGSDTFNAIVTCNNRLNLDYSLLNTAIQLTLSTWNVRVEKSNNKLFDTVNGFASIKSIKGTDNIDTFTISSVIDQLVITGGAISADELAFAASTGEMTFNLDTKQTITQNNKTMTFEGELSSMSVAQGTVLNVNYVDGYINKSTLDIEGAITFSSASNLSAYGIYIDSSLGIVNLTNATAPTKNLLITATSVNGLNFTSPVGNTTLVVSTLDANVKQTYNVAKATTALLDMSDLDSTLVASISLSGKTSSVFDRFNLLVGNNVTFTGFTSILFSNNQSTTLNLSLDTGSVDDSYTNAIPLELFFGEDTKADTLNFTKNTSKSLGILFGDALYFNTSGSVVDLDQYNFRVSNVDLVSFAQTATTNSYFIEDNTSLYGNLQGTGTFKPGEGDNIVLHYSETDVLTFVQKDFTTISSTTHTLSIGVWENIYQIKIQESAFAANTVKFMGDEEHDIFSEIVLGTAKDKVYITSEVGRIMSSMTHSTNIYLNGKDDVDTLANDEINIANVSGGGQSSLYMSLGGSGELSLSIYSVIGIQNNDTLQSTNVQFFKFYSAKELTYSETVQGLGAEINKDYFADGKGFTLNTTTVGHVAITTDTMYNSPNGYKTVINMDAKQASITGLQNSSGALNVNGENELFFNAKFISDGNTNLDAKPVAPAFDYGSSSDSLYAVKAFEVEIQTSGNNTNNYSLNFFDPTFSTISHTVAYTTTIDKNNFMDQSFRNAVILPNFGASQSTYKIDISNQATHYTHKTTGNANFDNPVAKWGKTFIATHENTPIYEQTATIKMFDSTVTTNAGALDFSKSGNNQLDITMDLGNSSTLSNLLTSTSYRISGNTNENSNITYKGTLADTGTVTLMGNYIVRDRFVGGDRHSGEIFGDSYSSIMKDLGFAENRVVDLVTSVRKISIAVSVNLDIGNRNNVGSFMSVYDTPKFHDNDPYSSGGSFAQVYLSDEADEINIYGMEAGKIVNTGSSIDHIYFASDLNYIIEQFDGTFTEGNFTYTGAYLTVTDEYGNKMYFTEADFNDVTDWGGNQHGDNYDGGGYNGAGNTVQYYELNDGSLVAPIMEDHSLQRSDFVSYAGSGSSVAENTNQDDLFISLIAGEDLINNNADSLLENTEALTLLENAFDNTANNDFDEVLSLQDLGADNKNSLEDNIDFVQIQNLQEEVVNQEEIENTYKLENEGTEDPLLDQSQLLHKNSNNSGSHNL